MHPKCPIEIHGLERNPRTGNCSNCDRLHRIDHINNRRRNYTLEPHPYKYQDHCGQCNSESFKEKWASGKVQKLAEEAERLRKKDQEMAAKQQREQMFRDHEEQRKRLDRDETLKRIRRMREWKRTDSGYLGSSCRCPRCPDHIVSTCHNTASCLDCCIMGGEHIY